MKARRNKSNLIPVMERVEHAHLPEMSPEQRRDFIHTLNLWRVFDQYFEGVIQVAKEEKEYYWKVFQTFPLQAAV